MIHTKVLQQKASSNINIKRAVQLLYGALSADAPIQKTQLKKHVEKLILNSSKLSSWNKPLPSSIPQPSLSTRLYDSADPGASLQDIFTLPDTSAKELLVVQSAPEYVMKHFPSAIANNKQKTNVLYFSSQNPYLVKEDIVLLVKDENLDSKIFNVEWHLDDFELVKARDPNLLSFNSGYFLLFKDHSHSSAFYSESAGSFLDGMPFIASFAEASLDYGIKNLALPILGENCEVGKIQTQNGDSSLTEMRIELKSSVPDSNILEDQGDSDESKQEKFSAAEFLLMESVTEKLPPFKRKHCLVVHNLPYPMNAERIIRSFLWNYDVYPDYSKAVRLLKDDAECRYKAWIIAFDNEQDPIRFFRWYHGRYLNGDTNYPKILVDLLD